MGLALSPDVIPDIIVRIVLNAGIMVAASAFVATVNADVYRQVKSPALGGNGPHLRAYDSSLAEILRSLSVGVGLFLFVIIATFIFLLSGLSEWIFNARIQLFILVLQIVYYLLLALVFALSCKLRAIGPTHL